MISFTTERKQLKICSSGYRRPCKDEGMIWRVKGIILSFQIILIKKLEMEFQGKRYFVCSVSKGAFFTWVQNNRPTRLLAFRNLFDPQFFSNPALSIFEDGNENAHEEQVHDTLTGQMFTKNDP